MRTIPTSTRPVVEVRTHHTADALEARDTADRPLEFVRLFAAAPEVGDGAVIYSSCGCTFIGEVVDVEEDGRYYIALR